jgi:hypothetical protein
MSFEFSAFTMSTFLVRPDRRSSTLALPIYVNNITFLSSRMRSRVGVPRPDTHVLAYVALRITFANARACEGAPTGLRRGLDCLQPTTAGAVKVDSFRSSRANGNR